MEHFATTLLTVILASYLVMTSIGKITLFRALKLILAIHVLGDWVSDGYWQSVPTYAYINAITDDDRLVGNGLMLGCVVLTDFVQFIGNFVIKSGRNRSRESSMMVATLARPTGYSFIHFLLCVGLLLKLVIYWQIGWASVPEASLGSSGLLLIGEFLIPFSLAARHVRGGNRKSILMDILFLGALSLISFSKAQVLFYLFHYSLTYIVIYGFQRLRSTILNIKTLAIFLVLAVVVVSVKTQQRAGEQVELSPTVIGGSVLSGTSMRLLGGIQRTYLTVVREIIDNKAPLMDGSYTAQSLYLWIPRALWADKPRIASEALYNYLNVTEEPYGTAFAINVYGALLLDFGVIGLLISVFIFAICLFLGEQMVRSKFVLFPATFACPLQAFMRTAWWSLSIPLSEGGIPPAVTQFAILTVIFAVLLVCYIPLRTIIQRLFLTALRHRASAHL